ncbi:MAG: hypothetical protein LUQ32_02285 [Methanomicrobiales archaeon]|nr:hypothetical protein [Methanomicrobiales archaeon]
MIRKIAPLLVLILFALAMGAGCTSPAIPSGGGGPSGGTQAPPATQSPSGTQGAFSPGPVVTVPPDYFVEFQVNKNMIFTNPAIDVFFSGGKGQIFLQKVLVEVQKSDGTIESREMVRPEGGQISKGDKVTIRGTTGTDRVVITVTILGKSYKIHDQLYEFKTRP